MKKLFFELEVRDVWKNFFYGKIARLVEKLFLFKRYPLDYFFDYFLRESAYINKEKGYSPFPRLFLIKRFRNFIERAQNKKNDSILPDSIV